MKKFTKKLLTIAFVLTAAATIPTFAFAANVPDNYSGLVKCSGVKVNANEVECNFQTLISSIGSIINWLFFISVPIAVALFAYAGILHMSGKSDNKDKAKDIFKNVAIGFILMLIAFVVVQTLVGWVVDPSFGATTFLTP